MWFYGHVEMNIGTNKYICLLWARIYKRWLWNSFLKEYDMVYKVKGWRTALVGNSIERKTISPCFWIFK
ncbi:MAG: hypothetical protein Q7R95_07300 [bacterium]|nr:hypothetical protein [bacterium]